MLQNHVNSFFINVYIIEVKVSSVEAVDWHSGRKRVCVCDRNCELCERVLAFIMCEISIF